MCFAAMMCIHDNAICPAQVRHQRIIDKGLCNRDVSAIHRGPTSAMLNWRTVVRIRGWTGSKQTLGPLPQGAIWNLVVYGQFSSCYVIHWQTLDSRVGQHHTILRYKVLPAVNTRGAIFFHKKNVTIIIIIIDKQNTFRQQWTWSMSGLIVSAVTKKLDLGS